MASYNQTSILLVDMSTAEYIPLEEESGEYLLEGLGDDAVTRKATFFEIILMCIASIGIVSNLMVCIVILNTRSMRKKPFNIFILHQSFVDTIACLVQLFMQIFNNVNVVTSQKAADIYCKIWLSTLLGWVTIIASTYNLTFLTIERHSAVTKPLHYDQSRVKRRLPFVFLMVWMLPFANFAWDMDHSRVAEHSCRANIDTPPPMRKFFFYFRMFTNVLLPTTIMIGCYVHMGFSIRKSATKFDNISTNTSTKTICEKNHRQQTMRAAQRNVLQTGLLLVVMYIICWSYVTLILALIVHKVLNNFSSIQWNVALAIVLSNSCINPFIYSFRYHEFQKAFKYFILRVKGVVTPPSSDVELS